MKTNPVRKFLGAPLGASIAVLILASSGSAQTIQFQDDFTAAVANTGPFGTTGPAGVTTPGGVAWYNTSFNTLLSVNNGVLVANNTGNSSAMMMTFFAPKDNPVQLGLGEEIELSVDVRFDSTTKEVRLALLRSDPTLERPVFNSVTGIINNGSTATTSNTAVAPYVNWSGYQSQVNPTSTVVNIWERIMGLNTALVTTNSTWGGNSQAFSPTQTTGLTPGTFYTLKFIVQRSANGTVNAISTLSGGDLAAPITTGFWTDTNAWGGTGGETPATSPGSTTAFDVLAMTVGGTSGTPNTVSYDNVQITTRAMSPAPVIVTQPVAKTAPEGGSVTFTVVATGATGYQWKKDGVNIPAATDASLTLSPVLATDEGSYTVMVTNAGGPVTSSAATLTIGTATPSRLTNLSIRTGAGSGAQTLIAGFVTSGGSENASLLVRAAGPALIPHGVTGVLDDPLLAINNAVPVVVQSNDDWASALAAVFTQVGAFPWTEGSKDAAIALDLVAGPYTAHITGAGGTTGIVLAEIYDVNTTFAATKPQLVNVSARAQVNTGANIMIAGFVVAGDTTQNVLIRAVGPTLAGYGVTGVLADPQLAVFQGATQIEGNNDWAASLATTFSQVGAFSLDADSKDAALLLTLNPGVYTAQVSGVGDTTGVALVEVYAVP